MSTTDNYRSVLFNDGEELTYQDLIGVQDVVNSRMLDQILASMAPNIGVAGTLNDAEFTGQLGADIPTGPYAYCINPGGAYLRQGSANNKIQVAPGTLLQKTDATDGVTPKFLAYTFAGTEELAIANGDGTHPRVDVLQMKLELLDGDADSRIFSQDPVTATIDLDPLTTHLDTVFKARVTGKTGNNISVEIRTRASGSGVTYSEAGNAVLIECEDGVSTVADIEAAVAAATDALIEVDSAGTGANVYADPADVISATHLAEGTDRILVSQSMNKTRKVKCTLSIKQGTAAASPLYPNLDSGCVAIAGIVVGTLYVAGAGFIMGVDTTGTVAVVHDQRMPLGVRQHITFPTDFIFVAGTIFTLLNNLYVTSDGTSSQDLWIPCREGGNVGRLVGVTALVRDPSTLTSKISRLHYAGGGGTAFAVVHQAGANMNGSGTNTSRRRQGTLIAFQQLAVAASGPVVQANATSYMGPPIWSNGLRCPNEAFLSSSIDFNCVGLTYVAPVANFELGPVTFFIAHGL